MTFETIEANFHDSGCLPEIAYQQFRDTDLRNGWRAFKNCLMSTSLRGKASHKYPLEEADNVETFHSGNEPAQHHCS